MSDITKQKPLANDQQNRQNFATNVDERPLNPTTNAADLFGDTSGLTGITQGSPQQTGAEPSEEMQDDSYLRGGKSLNKQTNQTGIPKEAVSDKVYDENTFKGQSHVSRMRASDQAEEPDSDSEPQVSSDSSNNDQAVTVSFPTLSSETSTREDATNHRNDLTSPTATDAVEGEEWVGGDMPNVESDDDTLANAQMMGMQLGEDEEHPMELDIARDVDRAEQAARDT